MLTDTMSRLCSAKSVIHQQHDSHKRENKLVFLSLEGR